MQSSILQTSAFITYMLSIYCAASMLPCGRYYYDPEGGYVGNPWVKFSYQYAYLYMAWIIHHLDVLEYYSFQYASTYIIRASSLYSRSFWTYRWSVYMRNVNNEATGRTPAKVMRTQAYKNLDEAWTRN